jgi:hypothetical protein
MVRENLKIRFSPKFPRKFTGPLGTPNPPQKHPKNAKKPGRSRLVPKMTRIGGHFEKSGNFFNRGSFFSLFLSFSAHIPYLRHFSWEERRRIFFSSEKYFFWVLGQKSKIGRKKKTVPREKNSFFAIFRKSRK